MHVLVLDGYFDLATAYFAGIYEMKHLPMPVSLQRNIEYGFFMTGHEPYIDAGPRRAIHDRVSAFVKASETGQ